MNQSPDYDHRSCAEGAQHGHHYRAFDLRCEKALGLQLTADGEDECEQYQQMPLCGKVGAERARAWAALDPADA